jgi:glutamate dehydrogenase (NAD(P)+)
MEGMTDGELYRNTMSIMEKAGSVIKINPHCLERLRYPRRAVTVSLPIRMDNGSLKVFSGYRVQHNQTLGPFKGGIRYHQSVNISEVAALSALMTFKNSLLGLPLGGAKGGIQVDPSKLSMQETEALSRRYASEMGPFIGPDKDIPAPDVGTSSQTMAWMMDQYGMDTGFSNTGVVTGKPIEVGGSQGREAATGLGVIYVVEEALKKTNSNIRGTTIAIQGFGKVGMYAAIEAHQLGAKIVAVSDVNGALHNGSGLDIPALVTHYQKSGTLAGFAGGKAITNDDLLAVDAHVLAPCAMDGTITRHNANVIKAKIIAEGANGPITSEADEILRGKNVLVIPDILANGGGVAVSYFEWVQDIVWLFWDEAEVRNRLRTVMVRSFDKVWDFSQNNRVDMRTSAMAVSLQRLESAMKLRGQIW